MDCSQAYHCLQMTNQRSMKMMAFNFASRTAAYTRLAQGLSRALSAFSSYIREYLDNVIKAEQCAQYVDDIDIGANGADHLIANLRVTFKCIQEAGLKLTMHKCHFWATEIDFVGRTITPQSVKPQKQKFRSFSEKLISRSRERLYNVIREFWIITATTSWDCSNTYKMLKSDKKVLLCNELIQQFEEINKALGKCCDLALQQRLPKKQVTLMTDASFAAAGHAVLIKILTRNLPHSANHIPQWLLDPKLSPQTRSRCPIHKKFLAMYFAFKEFRHILWERPNRSSSSPTINL